MYLKVGIADNIQSGAYLFYRPYQPKPLQTYRGHPKKEKKFPCGICERAVTWSRTKPSVACDDCNTWYHKSCIGMSSQICQGIKPDTHGNAIGVGYQISWISPCSTTQRCHWLIDTALYLSLTNSSSPKAAQNLPKDIYLLLVLQRTR